MIQVLGEALFFTVLYILFVLVIIFPPTEAVSAGLTIEGILGSWLGSETSFIHYQIRRTSVTILAHAMLLPGYFVMMLWCYPHVVQQLSQISAIPVYLTLLSHIPFVWALYVVMGWWKDNWGGHPLAQAISRYAPPDVNFRNNWMMVANDINREYMRVDKFSTQLNSISRIIVTDSWFIKVTSYTIYLQQLSDTVLILEKSYDVAITPSSSGPKQFLTVGVRSTQGGARLFRFRIESSYWHELNQKMINPVITQDIVIRGSLVDRFLPAFTDTVSRNPRALANEIEMDVCLGCMVTRANVKLERLCSIEEEGSQCRPCMCRPMWCLTCLCKWFAARQDANQPETWLSSTAPCPTCRSRFCLLDVRLVDTE